MLSVWETEMEPGAGVTVECPRSYLQSLRVQRDCLARDLLTQLLYWRTIGRERRLLTQVWSSSL